MVAMPIGLVIKSVAKKKLDKVYLGSTVFLLVMGGATLVYRNPLFLYWKPTVFYWVMSVVFLASHWVGDKTIAQRLFGKVGDMPRNKWQVLNLAWAVFFVIIGVLNIYVAYNFSEAFWVKFKVFGLTALTLVFAIMQAVWMTKAMRKKDSADEQLEAE